MEARPKIKLILSPLDKTIEYFAILILIALWGFAIYSFVKLPTTIPIHYNAAGKADDFGNKTSLFLLPAIGTILYFSLTVLNMYPQKFNYLTQITGDNAKKQYTITTKMIRHLKLIILLIFLVILFLTYRTSFGLGNGLGKWFLPITILLPLVPILFSIKQSLFNKKKDLLR